MYRLSRGVTPNSMPDLVVPKRLNGKGILLKNMMKFESMIIVNNIK